MAIVKEFYPKIIGNLTKEVRIFVSHGKDDTISNDGDVSVVNFGDESLKADSVVKVDDEVKCIERN